MNQLNNLLKNGFASKALSSPRMIPASEALARGLLVKSEGLVKNILSTPFFTGPSKLTQKQLESFLKSTSRLDSTQLVKTDKRDLTVYNPMPLKQITYQWKQLSQQVQFNVISTKEFHEQKKKYTKVKAFLKEFALLLKEGTKDTYTDGKWYFNLLRKKSRSEMTGYEVRQSLRIRSDLFKIIPFSFFVIVPMAELLLPFYLLLFPNAMPSQYTFDYTYDQKIQQLEDNQATSHEALVHMLKTHLVEKCNVSVDHFLHSDTYKQVFFKYYKSFDEPNGLDFQKMSSDDLLQVCHFLGMEVITGTAIVSKILQAVINTPIFFTNLGRAAFKQEKFSYSSFQLKFNFGPFEILKRNLILLQIKRHLSLLRQQDQAFFKMGFQDIIGHRITDFARERGITTITCYETLKTVLSNEWVNICRDKEFNDNAMFWYAIMQYDFLRNANNDMN